MTLTDALARLDRIEAKLWPPDPPDTAPALASTMADYAGVWPAGKLLADAGKTWRNVAGVPLTTPPSGFPGQPSQWGHLFIEVAASEPAPEEWPAWVQPTGAHDAYAKGAKVTHAGRRWTSNVAGNVWPPPTQWTDQGPA